MNIQPYLYFNGHCEDAITFYSKAVDAHLVALSRFRDQPGTPIPDGADDKILHADIRIGETTILASDGECGGSTDFRGFSLAVMTEENETAERYFGALSDGGTVQVPLISTHFASRFGMVADRYGLLWTISTNRPDKAA
jgi:PhnB protein